MPMVKVKEKFQVTIPTAIRLETGLAIGDYLEAVIEGRSIVLKPKALADGDSVEAAIQEGLRTVEEGRVTPAFSSMEEVEAAIEEGLKPPCSGLDPERCKNQRALNTQGSGSSPEHKT